MTPHDSSPSIKGLVMRVAASAIVLCCAVSCATAQTATGPAASTASAAATGRSGVSTTLPAQPAVTDTALRTAEHDDTSIPAATRLSRPVDAAAISVPWLYISTSHNDRTLTVQYIAAEGDCLTHRGFIVSETASFIELTVVDQRDLSKTSCANDLLELRATITLHAPLGNRALLHAPVAPTYQDFRW